MSTSLQARFDAAISVINEHNLVLLDPGKVYQTGNYPEGWVDPDKFIAKLKAIGGTSEDRLTKLSAEDLLVCLVESRDVGHSPWRPLPLAKDIVHALRGKTELKEQGGDSAGPAFVSGKKADRMSPVQLVANYDIEDPDNAVGKRLKAMSKGEPFIVFVGCGIVVDVVASLTLLQEIRKGYRGREMYVTSEGDTLPVYRVGERPDAFADENPIYEGRPLRPDGTCDQTNRSWEGVSLEARQMVRLAIDTNNIIVDADSAQDLMDIAVSPTALKRLRQRYPKAALKFKELEGTGDLPKLKIALVTRKELAASRPFDQGKKVEIHHPPIPIQKYVNKYNHETKALEKANRRGCSLCPLR